MYFAGALLIVSFPAWWLAAAISYFFEFYYLAASFAFVGSSPLLLAIRIASPKFRRHAQPQDIPKEQAVAECSEFDTVGI
jgi:hypothetical protein